MTVNDDSPHIQANPVLGQKENYNTSDADLLLLLSKWIKFDQKKNNWQEFILSRFGAFPTILTASPDELENNLKLSDKDCAGIKLFYEAALRLLKMKIYDCSILNHKKFLTDYLIAFLSREYIEHFFIYFLDSEGRIISENHQGSGTVNATSVYIREITKNALENKAASLILVHNHPSGLAEPSPADEKLTRAIIQALSVVGIKVSDHIIIGNGCYFSFQEGGLFQVQNSKRKGLR